MRIKVNAVEKNVNVTTLAALCHALGYQSQLVATAVNGEFVPRDSRENKSIQEGDSIEIVAPMQGG